MDQQTMAFMFEESLKSFRGYRGEPRHFCYWEHGFACLKRNHTKDRHPVLMSLDQHHFEDGLTSKEWNVLFVRAGQAWEDDHK